MSSFLAPDFDPDIFVSYAHGDAEGGSVPLRDWTHALIARLRGQLRPLEPDFKNINIWIDRDIDPTVKLNDQLRGLVGSSAVLVVVMSKKYLESSWCDDEREWFQEQIRQRPNESGRVFVLRAQETDTTLWPEFLRDLTGFSFYDPDTGYPWDFPDLTAPGTEFRKELMRLQVWLVKHLRAWGKRAVERAHDKTAASATPQAAGARFIYLHAPLGSEAEREIVRESLASEGIKPITASIRNPVSLAEWRRERAERIDLARNCEALTFLRVGDPGRFANDLAGIGVLERKEMAERRGEPPPWAVLEWTDEPLPIDGELFGVTRFNVTVPDWRREFRNWLDASHARPPGAAT